MDYSQRDFFFRFEGGGIEVFISSEEGTEASGGITASPVVDSELQGVSLTAVINCKIKM